MRGNIMYKESFAAAASAAQKKFNLLKTNPAGYVVLSILAGYLAVGDFNVKICLNASR